MRAVRLLALDNVPAAKALLPDLERDCTRYFSVTVADRRGLKIVVAESVNNLTFQIHRVPKRMLEIRVPYVAKKESKGRYIFHFIPYVFFANIGGEGRCDRYSSDIMTVNLGVAEPLSRGL